ncbi:cyclic nucleotide-binding domain-containing protein [Bacillus salipaludis]|uniref:Cyclic nucleotide-binding domain-containing protein n=1 Tax=Bacillus salipaludis TaxID=2547811 RepID=A0A4R5VR35_9BACI|nr:cyclic nucleotide-binding domain-containing protein [Bacillus salipaludis]MDQ6598369.1 cyclic nucleotide-binding domain-containing protein [Bacillus salipaludis]TDK61067.1 cyclic nucleotide-binding domain-containing protein [Bacillus salipaludis]
MNEIKNQEQLNDFLQKYELEPIFNENLLPYLSLFHFEQGENICSQGDAAEFLYVLVKGKLKIYTNSVEGKTLILSFKTPLEVIGDIEYVQNIHFINTVEAVSPVTLIGVQHHWLKKYASDFSPFLQFLLKIITEKFHLKSNSMSLSLMYPVEVRLASYLLSVSFDETNSPVNKQLSSVNLTDTANFIGTSYRHLNRVIQKFCEDGLVERNKGSIMVKDREGLQKLAIQHIYE